MLARKTVYIVHNAVPHMHLADKHWPTLLGCILSDVVVVLSTFTRLEVMKRYSLFSRIEPKQIRFPLVGAFPVASPRAPFNSGFDTRKIRFFGSVKLYKGASLMCDMMEINRNEAKGISLEVFGKWDAAIEPLKNKLCDLGAEVYDEYVADEDAIKIFSKQGIFILPYLSSSQSAVFYAMIQNGCIPDMFRRRRF